MSFLVWRLQIHHQLASTSDLCTERAKAGEPEGLAILARMQSAGRGTRGRAWSSPPGNLALSALLRPASTAAEVGRWSLIAGLAVIEALADYAPGRLQLKWPNDINLDGTKLAGVLIESAATPAGMIDWLVIGIGANLAVAPRLADRATACLPSPGAAPDPVDVAPIVLARLSHWRTILAEDGFGPVRDAWLANAHPLGTPLLIADPAGRRTGIFAGLADSGALLLESEGHTEQVTTAEVQHIPLAS